MDKLIELLAVLVPVLGGLAGAAALVRQLRKDKEERVAAREDDVVTLARVKTETEEAIWTRAKSIMEAQTEEIAGLTEKLRDALKRIGMLETEVHRLTALNESLEKTVSYLTNKDC